ncbi:Hypp2830 [Branchiostoma lanceolatum]|uniref:Hypp2830 protein n=1 Tax=Branchiostoma lanceolatum TaxID=7740 RepID=A0A8J9ZZM1_BRALA|nr:Hypp2830 [Branchiostoma lanceolatum]
MPVDSPDNPHDGSFEVPDRNLDDTIADVSVEDNLSVDEGCEVTFEFELVEFGTKRDTISWQTATAIPTKEETPPLSGAIYWACSRRKTGEKCPATVIESNRGVSAREQPA